MYKNTYICTISSEMIVNTLLKCVVHLHCTTTTQHQHLNTNYDRRMQQNIYKKTITPTKYTKQQQQQQQQNI